MDPSDDNPWGTPTPTTPTEPPSIPSSVVLTETTTTVLPAEESFVPEEQEEEEEEESIPPPTTTTIMINKVDDDSDDEPVQEEEEVVVEVKEEGEFTERIESPSVVLPRKLSIASELPPMDEFPSTPPIPSSSSSLTSIESTPETGFEDEFDDFADFGEAGVAGEDDDDFGSFGGEEDEFNLPPPLSSFTLPVPDTFTSNASREEYFNSVPPIASTSTSRYPTLDLTLPTVEGVRPQLVGFLERIYPTSGSTISDEHERQVDGVAQVLVTEGLRSLLVNLSSLPALKPLDWRRSRIRREHLITLGVPINLDDSPDAKPLASLILPSQLKPRSSSPSTRSPLVASPQSISSNNKPFSSSPLPSRSSTPNPSSSSSSSNYRNPINPAPVPPQLNVVRAKEICDYLELDLSLFSLEKLRGLKLEMEEFNQSVSKRLQFELGVREKEVGDGETYHAMIQDLVSAASKMKTTGGVGGSVSRTASGSGTSRWGRKSSAKS